ncbi:mechanosensitive ion channel family protein [Litoribacter ruber]|uniref:Mechanosensitive ion channel family protein n=1 Tax=Litoribacter ruber TaxID=702568 RepID=A0AAP2CEY5_9BACT|nr:MULTISPECIES: mechanosensitive ion channel family protein [Litoribacter]MBS9522617.1 mechanosensitive ion channel family protein [Litoribacter alkaliphilus]MBT0811146.1 mechanosensitive ion channel family protein [Litoribacter ruber]
MRLLKCLLFSLIVSALIVHQGQGQVFSDQSMLPVDPAEYDNLSTPYNTTLTFLYNLQQDTFRPEVAARALETGSVPHKDAQDLAIKLKQIFDGNGVLVRMGEIPTQADFRDSLHNQEAKFFFDTHRLPRVFLEKVDDEWKFSRFTVEHIEELHAETYPLGTATLLNVLPQLGEKQYVGLQLWQLIGLFLLILLIFTAHKAFTFIVDRVLFFVLQKSGYGEVAEKYLLPVARLVSIYLIVVLLAIFIRVLQLPIEVVSWVVLLLNAAKPFIVTIIFYKLVDIISLYLEKLALKTESTLDDQLVPLVRKTMKAFVVVIGVLFILKDGLQVDIVPFLTGLSIGGLAFALAAQDTIKNFFGSVMIFIDKPFQVGDWISSGDIDGTVEEVGFRSTRVRTFRNSLVYVPNGKLADMTIDNHGLRKYRRFNTTLTITYDTPPELVDMFVQGLREMVVKHPSTRKDYYNIYFNNLSAYSLDVMFYVFFEVGTWQEELQGRHDLLIQTVKLANKIGVRFAFPTQTLHMETFPEKKGFTPTYEGDNSKYQQKLNEFIQTELNKN